MFYPEKRDGFARLGRIDGIKTPHMVEFPGDELIEKIDFGKAPVAAKFFADISEELLPKGDFSVLTGISSLSPRQIVELFKKYHGVKPIYAVAAATPKNVSLLIYLGADLVDNILAIAKAYSGVFFSGDVEIPVEAAEGMCGCEYCSDLSDPENVARHNTEVLRQEVERCRYLLRKEELRNYVEAKVKLDPELTATLRIADLSSDHGFPRFRKSRCYFSTLESASRFEVRYFLSKAVECYEPKSEVLLILPCTARKPYLLSKTHRAIRSRVKIAVNEIIVSSPLVVPREFELTYPAINYDTPVTGQWSDEEVAFVAEWLRRFVEKGEFEKIVAHVEGGYRKVVERALHDYDVVFTAEDGLLSNASLKKLASQLSGYGGYDFRKEIFRHMSRYQFGVELDGRIKGRYPDLELHSESRMARIDTRYGMLDIYGEAARRLLRERRYHVIIEDFEPKGTIFAAGVSEADENIRPNDVVVFASQSLIGVGIAAMSGREMVEYEKGVAVSVRRVEPLG